VSKKRVIGNVAVVLAAIVLSCLGISSAIYLYMYPGPHKISSFDSPDGKWRLDVLEQVPTPRPFMQSPYTYQLCLYDRATGKQLAGVPGEMGNDSCAVNPTDFHVMWAAGEVTVKYNVPRVEYQGDFSKGTQVWVEKEPP
jgi:hypothetical protein